MLQVSQGEYDMIHASSPMRPNFEALTVCVHIIYIYIYRHTHIHTYVHTFTGGKSSRWWTRHPTCWCMKLNTPETL